MTSKFFVRHNDQPLYSLVSIINTGNLWNRTPYFLPLSSATPHKARYYLLYDHFIRSRHHCLHMTKNGSFHASQLTPTGEAGCCTKLKTQIHTGQNKKDLTDHRNQSDLFLKRVQATQSRKKQINIGRVLSICYQGGNLKSENPVVMRVCGLSYPLLPYSNSIVAGGLVV